MKKTRYIQVGGTRFHESRLDFRRIGKCCPFCGSQDLWLGCHHAEELYIIDETCISLCGQVYVRCDWCSCTGPLGTEYETAVFLWSSRDTSEDSKVEATE